MLITKFPKTGLLFLFLVFNLSAYFSQNKLQDALNATQKKEQLKRDSLFKAIQITKNDTLKANLYFEMFELSNYNEWIKYAPLIIHTADSLLNHTSPSAAMRKALLKRKAIAQRYCYYYYNNTEGSGSAKGLHALNEALAIFIQTGDAPELTVTYVSLAQDYSRQGKMLKQVQTLQEGLKYVSDKKFNRGISRFYVQLQFFYAEIGDTVQALSYIDKAVKLEAEIADKTRLARGYYLAGLSYSKMQKHLKAIDYLLLSVKAYKNDNMQQMERLGQTYFLLGEEYLILKEYDKALNAYENAIETGKKYDDFRSIFLSTLAKGKTFSLKGDLNKALAIHNEMLKLVETSANDETPVRMCCWQLAQDYYLQKDYTKAAKYMERVLKIAKQEGILTELFEYEKKAYQIDSANNYFEGAYKHYYQYQALKEQLNKEEVLKLAAKDRFQSELEFQKITFKTEQEKKDIVAKDEKRKQNIIIWSVLGGLLLVSLFLIFVFRSLRITQKQKQIIELQKKDVEAQKHIIEEKSRELEEKNKDILDSIRYARRIQTSLLPTEKYIERILNRNTKNDKT